MKKTFLELKEIDDCVAKIYAKYPDIQNSKFGYWYKRFFKKNLQPIIGELEEKLADCRLENALVDEKTREVLYTDSSQRTYKFDKEGLKKLLNFNRVLLEEYNHKEFEITPFISSEAPEGLTDEDKELLKGILID